MNNAQFRRIVLDTPTARPSTSKEASAPTPRRGEVSSNALGSRMRSSIPMTPRSVVGSSGVDFARQLAECSAEAVSAKKFRSSAAPKGVKLPSGYRDRTQDRAASTQDDDDKASRIQALEEMVKLGQMDKAVFEKVRDEIVGGDIGTTHLVKGLDYKLLERVKRGEDVLNENTSRGKRENQPQVMEQEVDEELDKVQAKDIAPVVRDKAPKKGEMAPPIPTAVAGKKRSRDEILAELKASRRAAASQNLVSQPQLGPKFRKLGEKREPSRIEIDDRGREVLITVDEEGRVKRKVKRATAGASAEDAAKKNGLLMPDKDAVPLGMEVPTLPTKGQQEEPLDRGDIFEDAGSDYDPLGGIDEEDDSNDDDDDDDGHSRNARKDHAALSIPQQGDDKTPPRSSSEASNQPNTGDGSAMPPPPPPATRNYFSTISASSTNDSTMDTSSTSNPLKDPTILAALRKASTLNPLSKHAENDDGKGQEDEEAARLARRQKLLSNQDRDAEDLDMGFGSSRLEDEEDMEEKRVKLSVWGVGGGDDVAGTEGGRTKKRKRGPKKKKGDGNNAADVLRVLEKRKAEAG